MSHSTSGEEAAASLLHSGTVRAAQRDPRRTCLAVQELLAGGGESRWHGPTLQLGTGTNLKSSRWDADFGSAEDAEFDHSSVPGQLGGWSPTLTRLTLPSLPVGSETEHNHQAQGPEPESGLDQYRNWRSAPGWLRESEGEKSWRVG